MGTLVIADEAYADFAGKSMIPLINKHPNLIVTKTLSKAQAMAGVRVGFGIANEALIQELNKVRPPYNINKVSQAGALAALKNWNAFAAQIKMIVAERERTTAELRTRTFNVLPSEANFVFAKTPRGTRASSDWQKDIEDRGILVRNFGNSIQNFENYLRITIGSRDEMDQLLKAIDDIQGLR
jgi:histidinol-phosphate aminotransferase